MQDLIDHAGPVASKYLTYAGLGFGSVSGAVTWMNENAGAVGAMCSVGGLVMGAVFGVIHIGIARAKLRQGRD